MKWFAFLLLVCWCGLARCATPPSSAEEQVLNVEIRFNQAFADNNLPLYYSFLAPDFTQ